VCGKLDPPGASLKSNRLGQVQRYVESATYGNAAQGRAIRAADSARFAAADGAAVMRADGATPVTKW